MPTYLNFSGALDVIKRGGRVTREGWNGKNQWIELQKPDENSKMSLPYIYIKTVGGDLAPWVASQTDILAEDWEEIFE
jgi:hypothetical protein